MESDSVDEIRNSIRNLSGDVEILLAQSRDFPAIQQNAKRADACIRMMRIALGEVIRTPGEAEHW